MTMTIVFEAMATSALRGQLLDKPKPAWQEPSA